MASKLKLPEFTDDAPWLIEQDTMVMAGKRAIASFGGYTSNVNTEQVRRENMANAQIAFAAPEMLAALLSGNIFTGEIGHSMLDEVADLLEQECGFVLLPQSLRRKAQLEREALAKIITEMKRNETS